MGLCSLQIVAAMGRTDAVLEYLLEQYDHHQRPNPEEPTRVSVDISISDIYQDANELNTVLILGETWHDPRLAYNVRLIVIE